MIKILLASLFFASTVFAGLPPTTQKGQSGSTKPTVFFTEVPYNQSTETAAVTGLIETGNNNLLANANFEHVRPAASWTLGSGVTSAGITTGQQQGLKALRLTLTAVNGLVISQDVTPTIEMVGQYDQSIWVKTTQSTVQVCARRAGATSGTCSTVNGNGVWQPYNVGLMAPGSGSVGISIVTNGSTTGTIDIDHSYVGPSRSSSQQAQAYFFGGAQQDGAANCLYSQNTSTSESNYVDLSTAPSCASAWTSYGNVTAVGATSSSITVANMPPGDYKVELAGNFSTSASGNNCNFQISDGTNNFGYTTNFSSGVGAMATGQLLGRQLYTTSATRTLKIVSSNSGGAGATICSVSNNSAGRKFIWRVWYFPTQSQLSQQLNIPQGPTVQRFLSGSGTYTRPNNVKYIVVEMVGGGGGGSGSGDSGGGGNGGAGGNTTFGTSLLTANGGSGGVSISGTGGAGGSVTINAPAVNISSMSGSTGSGGSTSSSTVAGSPAGGGGVGFFGGGIGSVYAINGMSPITNSGSGGTGGGMAGINNTAGAGGGAGGYVNAIVNNPDATYSYSIGTAGTAGTAGTNGRVGGAGSSGIIIVTEYYNTGDVINPYPGSITTNASFSKRQSEGSFTCSSSSAINSQDDVTYTSIANIASSSCVVNYTGWNVIPRCYAQLKACSAGGTACYLSNQLASPNLTTNTISCRDDAGGACTNFTFDMLCSAQR